MDSYVRRCTKAFSFLWSFLTLAVAVVGFLLGATTEPAPDIFIVVFGMFTGFGAAVIGFMHGVTLSASRNLDAKNATATEEDPNALRCYDEYCTGVNCSYRHS